MAIVGPTASGKSAVAESVARRLGAAIVSVDSMQVYRGMDIGTAKPDVAARREFDYRMIDLCEPEEDHTVAAFQRAGRDALAGLADRPVVVAGGSGLHFRALVDPLRFPPRDSALAASLEHADPEALVAELLAADPAAPEHVDLANPRRVARAVEILRLTGRSPSARARTREATAVRTFEAEVPFVGFGIDPGGELRHRVRRRLETMMAAGLLDEVASLAGRLGRTASQAVGYKELLPVVAGDRSEAEGVEAAMAATMALAKRQRTFFGKDPRLRWLAWQDDPDAIAETIVAALEEDPAWTS